MSKALRPQVRPGSGRYREENPYKFPFEAFEADQAKGNSAPALTVKSPWSLGVDGDLAVTGNAEVTGDLSVTGDTTISGSLFASPPLLHIEDHKTSGTHGGDFTSGAWRTRDLNTVVTNEITGASLASNQITLPAGTYEVEWSAPVHYVIAHGSRLYDTTNSELLLSGINTYAGSGVGNISPGFGRITLTAEAVLELQHQCGATRAGNGFGVALGNYFTVDHETYSVIRIRRIA